MDGTVFKTAAQATTKGGWATPTRQADCAPQNGHRPFLIMKQDAEQQLIYGEVYAPGPPDSQGDFMVPAEIQKMAHDFLRRGLVTKIDLSHSRKESGCCIVESFIARDGDPHFIAGSWVIGVHVPDDIWPLVKSGELNGFSLDGEGFRVPTEVRMEVPEVLSGQTDDVDGHTHTFFVKFSDEGVFLGGVTDAGPDGHFHRIVRGTLTETEAGHAHRFSFVEGMLNA